jgi:hypothetical protein
MATISKPVKGNSATSKPAKGKPARAAAPATTAPATTAPATTAPATTAPPAGGYVVLRSACPARDGTTRAARWPLLLAHAGQPGGIKSLHAALKAGGHWASARGMLAWCNGAGYVQVDGMAPPPAKPAKG